MQCLNLISIDISDLLNRLTKFDFGHVLHKESTPVLGIASMPAEWGNISDWGMQDVNSEGHSVRIGPDRSQYLAYLREAVAANASHAVDMELESDRRRMNARNHPIQHQRPPPDHGPTIRSPRRKIPIPVCNMIGRYMGTGGEQQMLPDGGNPAYIFQPPVETIPCKKPTSAPCKRRHTGKSTCPNHIPAQPLPDEGEISDSPQPRRRRRRAGAGQGEHITRAALPRVESGGGIHYNGVRDSPPLGSEWPIDVDMYYGLFPVAFLPQHPLLVYRCHRAPILQVHGHTANTYQICPYPSICVEVPVGFTGEAFKKHLARVFYDAGCEQPMAADPDDAQMFNQGLAVPSTLFAKILLVAGITHVYVQDFGMKLYLGAAGLSIIASLPDVPSPYTGIDIGRMHRFHDNLVLFGLPVNSSGVYRDVVNRMDWKVYAMVPFAQCGLKEGNYIYGYWFHVGFILVSSWFSKMNHSPNQTDDFLK